MNRKKSRATIIRASAIGPKRAGNIDPIRHPDFPPMARHPDESFAAAKLFILVTNLLSKLLGSLNLI